MVRIFILLRKCDWGYDISDTMLVHMMLLHTMLLHMMPDAILQEDRLVLAELAITSCE